MLDDALVLIPEDLFIQIEPVSILVVLDDALVHLTGFSGCCCSFTVVSILVVLDDALVLIMNILIII